MVLFSSFNHVYVFLMFFYLGLLSGAIFQVAHKVLIIVDKSIKIKPLIQKQKINKSLIKSDLITANKKSKTTKNKQTASNKKIKIIAKLKSIIRLIVHKGKKTLLDILSIITLVAVVALSCYINFYYNMGEIRIIFIMVWIFAFWLARIMVNLLAKKVLTFYNYFKKKFNKQSELRDK